LGRRSLLATHWVWVGRSEGTMRMRRDRRRWKEKGC
jgi:hypothetical protein